MIATITPIIAHDVDDNTKPCDPISVSMITPGSRPKKLAIKNFREDMPVSPATKFMTSVGNTGSTKAIVKKGTPFSSAMVSHLLTSSGDAKKGGKMHPKLCVLFMKQNMFLVTRRWDPHSLFRKRG